MFFDFLQFIMVSLGRMVNSTSHVVEHLVGIVGSPFFVGTNAGVQYRRLPIRASALLSGES